jgi:type IX secretion system PorP/SprF family membrane protein
MKKVLLVIAALLVVTSARVSAQQDPQFSMYMFNKMVLNPAYAGARGATNITAVGRSQWVGIDGHPNSFTLSADAPINVLSGGVGGYFIYDQIGPIQTLGLRASYAFRYDFAGERGDGPAIQIGLQPGFYFKQLDGTNLRPEQVGDPALRGLIGTTTSANAFDLGAGVYFTLPDDKLYLGIGADHLLEPNLEFEGDRQPQPRLNETNLTRMFSFMGGYRIGDPDAPVNVIPSTFIKMAGSDPTSSQLQIDANVNVEVDPMVFGVSYRALDAQELVGIVGFNANQRLFVGYSYDYTFSALQSQTSGSHEIILSYTFPKLTKFYPPNLDTMDKPALR